MAAKKEFFIRVKGELVEVTQEVYLSYYRAKRCEQAQIEKEQRHHVVSYDAFDTSSALGAEMLTDTASDEPEDIVVKKLMVEKLYSCIAKLTNNEGRLVCMLFFDGCRERETAQKLGLSSMTVHNKKERILAKLLKLLKT